MYTGLNAFCRFFWVSHSLTESEFVIVLTLLLYLHCYCINCYWQGGSMISADLARVVWASWSTLPSIQSIHTCCSPFKHHLLSMMRRFGIEILWHFWNKCLCIELGLLPSICGAHCTFVHKSKTSPHKITHVFTSLTISTSLGFMTFHLIMVIMVIMVLMVLMVKIMAIMVIVVFMVIVVIAAIKVISILTCQSQVKSVKSY